MAMFDQSALRVAFRTKLNTLVGLPDGAQRAWENQSFVPTSNVRWMEELLAISFEEKTTTGNIEAQGFITYTLFEPIGVGTESIEAVAKILAEGFEAGQSLVNGGLQAILEHTERLNGRDKTKRDGNLSLWYAIPVVIHWRVFTATSP